MARSKGKNAKMGARPALEIWGGGLAPVATGQADLAGGRHILPAASAAREGKEENSRRVDPSSLNSTNLNGSSSS